MTDRQINIAIAEACGIIDVDQWGPLYKTPSGWVRDCPDYCNDLNAMHEAEEFLKYDSESTWLKGGYSLYVQLLPYGNEISATARQRAEAFLRTFGKWEEETNE